MNLHEYQGKNLLKSFGVTIQEGIVAGGGVALIRAMSALDSLSLDNEDQNTGVQIVRSAIQAPLRTIVENAGGEGQRGQRTQTDCPAGARRSRAQRRQGDGVGSSDQPQVRWFVAQYPEKPGAGHSGA